MTDNTSRRFRLTMFGVLYFVQGAGLAYFRNFQKPYLSSINIDADTIGLLASLLLLPFILKIFIGIISDRVNLAGFGHRKPYIILGLVLAIFAFAGAGLVDPAERIGLFAVLIVLGSFSAALFDSTTDGLAIDTTPFEDHGAVQGAMVSGRALGFIILSLVFGVLVQSYGYRIVFAIIAASMLLPFIWVRRIQEPAKRQQTQKFDWQAFKALKQPRFLIFALYALFGSLVVSGADGLVTLFMSDQFKAAEMHIGQYGALRGLGTVVGAVIGGLLVDRIGRKRSAIGGIVAISIGAVLIGFAPGVGFLLIIGVIWGIAGGFQETIFVALAMDLSDRRIAASMFAVMMTVANVGTAIGEGVATGLTDNLSFSAIFWFLALLNVVNIPILGWLFKKAPDIAYRVAAPQPSAD